MPAQVAFLRAINVGHRQVKMERLREVLTDLGLTGVRTHIASGNAWFDSRSGGARLEARIERALASAFGFEIETFVRTRDELGQVLEAIPFADADVEGAHALMVCFLRDVPAAASCRAVRELDTATDWFRVSGRELYWLRRAPESDPTIQKSLDRLLPGPMTGRKVTTVRRMAER